MISLLIMSSSLLLTIFSGYAQDCQEHVLTYTCTVKDCKVEALFESLNLCRKEFIIEGQFLGTGGEVATQVTFTYWSNLPSAPTELPTGNPTTELPTELPTEYPTRGPTELPTGNPTTELPTELPTKHPTRGPTELPTRNPTGLPTEHPSRGPTKLPTGNPTTKLPTKLPTRSPTRKVYTRLGNKNDYVAVDEGNEVLYNGKGGFFVNSLGDCEDACSKTEGCHSFAFCLNKSCWLKDKVFNGDEETKLKGCATYYES